MDNNNECLDDIKFLLLDIRDQEHIHSKFIKKINLIINIILIYLGIKFILLIGIIILFIYHGSSILNGIM